MRRQIATSLAILLLLAATASAASAARSTGQQPVGRAILADEQFFDPGLLDRFLGALETGSQVLDVPEWQRPNIGDIEEKYGPPDAVVSTHLEYEGIASEHRSYVYDDIALGVEDSAPNGLVAWVAAWAPPEVEPTGQEGVQPAAPLPDEPFDPNAEKLRACPMFIDGTWTGRSGVGNLRFVVASRALVEVRIDFNISNGGCSANGYTTITYSSPRPISGTSFTVSVPPVPQLGFTLQMTFNSDASASGTLNFVFTPCNYNRTSSANASNRTFGFCVDPSSQTVAPGGMATFPVQITSIGGFTDPVTLTTAVSPSGGSVSSALNTTTVTPGNGATLTVTTASSTPLGNYTVTVTGATTTGHTHTQTATVTVATPDFTIAVDPAELSGTRGQSGSLNVLIDRIAGFDGNVTVIAPNTKPIKVKLKPPEQSTTGTSVSFTWKIKKKAVAGSYPVVFTARDGTGRERTATLTVTVQ